MFRAVAQGGLNYGKDLTGVFRCILLALALWKFEMSVLVSWYVREAARPPEARWQTRGQLRLGEDPQLLGRDTAEVYSAHSYSWSYPGLPDTYKATGD